MQKLFLTALTSVSLSLISFSASAQATNPFVGEIMIVSFNYCPGNWLPADGRLLNTTDYQTLYDVIGTTYGGDGATTFALPKLTLKNPNTTKPFLACITPLGVYPSRN
jgi:microcystin-dependent protein